MTQFSTWGGKGFQPRVARLSFEYSRERCSSLLLKGRSSPLLTLLCTSTLVVSQGGPTAKPGSLMSYFRSLEWGHLPPLFPLKASYSVKVHFVKRKQGCNIVQILTLKFRVLSFTLKYIFKCTENETKSLFESISSPGSFCSGVLFHPLLLNCQV